MEPKTSVLPMTNADPDTVRVLSFDITANKIFFQRGVWSTPIKCFAAPGQVCRVLAKVSTNLSTIFVRREDS